jgi:hypothetical protein
MVTRSSQVRRLLVGLAAVAAALACTSPPPASATASTVVASTCVNGGPYQETITSTATPARPAAGQAVRFELGVRRLQIDMGPMREGRYTFPIPAGVARVLGVEFADANPNTWEVSGTDLLVRFKAAEGDWLVNDFPRITILAALAPSLRTGDTVAWKPYRSFEQQFVFVEDALSCTVGNPDLVLQRMTIR